MLSMFSFGGDRRIILSIFTSHVFADNLINEFFATVELDGAPSVSAVPQTVMQLLSARSLVIHKKHVFFLTGNIRDHSVSPCLLFYMPNDLRVGFLRVEFRACKGPEL